MSFGQRVFENRSVVFLSVVLLMAFGLYSYFNLPAREDPAITIRVANVTALNPSMSAEHMELLVTKTLEEAIRQQGEVEKISSITQPGRSIIKVEIKSKYFELEQIWDDIRDRLAAVQSDLPAGTLPPLLNDDFGNVAAATIALQSTDYNMAEQFDMAQYLRDQLFGIPNTKRIDILGAQAERVYVEISNTKLAELGILPDEIIATLAQQNIIQAAGGIDTGVSNYIVEPTGTFNTLEDIENTLIRLPNTTTILALKDIANIRKAYIDPPSRKTYFNGAPAIMLTLTMVEGNSVLDYGEAARAKIDYLKTTLPAGYTLSIATFQADQVADAVFGVTSNVIQTLFIVLAVVIFFLGMRTGLIVGAIVPSVMLITIAIMGFYEINLQRMSLATLVISLGLLVDNGIVIAEDFKRRLDNGEDRTDALGLTVKELAFPLLSSTLTTILVFLPLMLAEHESGEYTRTISQVVMISLTTSWILAMTLTPILCTLFIKTPNKNSGPSGIREIGTKAFDKLNSLYSRALYRILKMRALFLITMVILFVAAVAGIRQVPQNFFPSSDRSQLLIYFDLPAGVTERQTDQELQQIFAFLDDEDKWPEILSTAGYTGFGGPRFVLSLAPIDPAPNRGFAVLNIDEFDNVKKVKFRLRDALTTQFPQVKAQVTNMFLGPSDPTIFEVEVSGPDAWTVYDTSNALQTLIAEQDGAVDIRNDWENRTIKLVVKVNQAKARLADVTSADINRSLNRYYNGERMSDFYDGDEIYPIVLRAPNAERRNLDSLQNIQVYSSMTGQSVGLTQVAQIQPENEFARVGREDLSRTATVSARNDFITAQDWAPILDEKFNVIRAALPPGHSIDLAGIVVTSQQGRAALAANMPLCLALVLILLVLQFNGFKRPALIFMTLPLLLIGAVIGLFVMRVDFGFMVILGLYALLGIIINNAIVLVDRIDLERKEDDSVDAIIRASVMRLRPILMTTITTILGLMPLILAVDPLFYGLAVVVAFGLAVGTILTLGVVPVLYSLMFGIKPHADDNSPSIEELRA
ncbi:MULTISPECIES: efflux RND transporter permease subunit [unclassified Pseudoalteromonas]|uniref:efflux RND transporter permease subunit n=1 Tax=unclassified Pseudoalteromonas TaxID=194690 RepID=UPI000BBE3EAC|nr:efflux RND transporter permease subunit [Pseudoalteromonas sp. 1_2015MBL_MicDiv]ATG79715.1 acriflavine resistance protein B [Pseudoalteromonas sp. 1_2015MBL_MicDiv]